MKKIQKIKQYVILTVFILSISILGYQYFTATINEIGFLGMDKTGRQIFIQTLNQFFSGIDNKTTITSDWDDFSFIERLWQEPMRTTLKIYETMDEEEYIKLKISEGFAKIFPSQEIETSLEIPYKEFLDDYRSEIKLTEDFSVTLEELEEMAERTGVITYRDLLRGFGFTKYEYYLNGELKTSITLNPKVVNAIIGNFFSTVGSSKNEPLEK